jgi:hypothetical protein
MSSTGKTLRRRRRKSGSPSSKRSAGRGSATLELNDDWNEFLHAPTSTGTRFLLIGGHAIAVHAEPRFTEDLDIFLAPGKANAKKLVRALDDFGFGSVTPPLDELTRPNCVWMLGRKPRRIDVLTGISGVSYAEAARGSVSVRVGGIKVRVIGKAALLKNMIASNRTKDRFDVELLMKYGRPRPRRP